VAGYAVTPIILLFKFLFTSICISIGAILSLTEIKFKDIDETAICLALDSGLQSEDSLRMFFATQLG